MMRYQSLSPECVPLPNGRKPNLRTTCKEDHNHHHDNARLPTFASIEPKPLRVRSGPNSSTSPDHHFPPSPLSDPITPTTNGDVLLQWGHNKRSRGARAEHRTAAKIQRRSITAVTKQSTAVMPPPTHNRASSRAPLNRNVEEWINGFSRVDKATHKASTANYDSLPQTNATNPSSAPSSEKGEAGKVNMDLFEWPRIYISLSRKEKEDDFLAMKGTKLPQRPKKRPKSIDKSLQVWNQPPTMYCFPGMWLSDLARGRYEVREKKCVKKKKRGLKGMESMDSDSD